MRITFDENSRLQSFAGVASKWKRPTDFKPRDCEFHRRSHRRVKRPGLRPAIDRATEFVVPDSFRAFDVTLDSLRENKDVAFRTLGSFAGEDLRMLDLEHDVALFDQCASRFDIVRRVGRCFVEHDVDRLASQEERREAVIVTRRDWIEFVVVALSAAERQAEQCAARRVDDVDHHVGSLELLVLFIAAVAGRCQEAGRDQVFV